MELSRLIDFLGLTHAFQRIDRRLTRPGEDRMENDAEHSYQLALAAWYLNDAESLGMDTGLLLKYALVHDLVEVHAGDTFAYTTDMGERESKEAREADAARQLAADYPDFPDLIAFIHGYERRADREGRFVYALDKLLPIINNYVDGGRGWVREGITLEAMKQYKVDKIAESPEVDRIFKQLIAVLEKQPSLFPRTLDAA